MAALTPADAANVEIPAGTHIVLNPSAALAAVGAHVGDDIDLVVGKPLIVGAYVAIPAGAAARGHVAEVTKLDVTNMSRGMSSMKIAVDWVQVEAGKIRLDDTPFEIKGHEADAVKRPTLFGLGSHKPMTTMPMLMPNIPVDATILKTVHVVTNLKATQLQKSADSSGGFIDK